MKILIDEQLQGILPALEVLGHTVQTPKALGLRKDAEIAAWATENDFTIITMDRRFVRDHAKNGTKFISISIADICTRIIIPKIAEMEGK